jgi:septal ring factor EnvC (AmiA/AmiB activator)
VEEIEELVNEIAELRQQADELRQQLKETEARLGTVEDDNEEQARIIDTLLDWCHEQESVLGQHRDVVAAMGAAAKVLEKGAPPGDLDSAVNQDNEPPT